MVGLERFEPTVSGDISRKFPLFSIKPLQTTPKKEEGK